MILFMDSFGHYSSVSDVLKKWSSAVEPGSIIIDTNICRRVGIQNLSIQNSDASLILYFIQQDIVILHFGFYPYALGYKICDVSLSGIEQCSLWSTADGRIQLKKNTTVLDESDPAILTNNVWHWLSFKVRAAVSGAAQVKINDSDVLPYSGNTSGINEGITGISLGYGRFSDFILLNTLGTVNTDFLTDRGVVYLAPNAAGTYSQLTPSTGNNYECIDESPPDTDDYVSSGTSSSLDTYNFPDLEGTPDIAGVQLVAYAKKDNMGARKARFVMLTDGVDPVYSDDIVLSDTVKFFRHIQELNPDTETAWGVSDFNDFEFGIQVGTSE